MVLRDYPTASAYVQKIDYSMDDDGNRTSVNVTPHGLSPTSANYDQQSQPVQQHRGTSRTHDANGNLTNVVRASSRPTIRTYLQGATRHESVIADYRYDASGRRVEKSVSGGIFQRYITRRGDDRDLGVGRVEAERVFGQGIDQVLMLEQADVLDYDADSNTTEIAKALPDERPWFGFGDHGREPERRGRYRYHPTVR
jgi:hypothetical protein